MEEFIYKWQTLVGSALGPFLAVILSAIGFWIKSTIERKNERKEFLRRIEVGITRTLNGTFKTRLKLQGFVTRLRTLISEIRAVTDERTFALETINFPTIQNIYRDVDAPNFKIKSYYLHNKLLWADAGTKETNEIIANLKSDFAELIGRNERFVALLTNNKNPNPAQQRAGYANNLESFANSIDEFTNKFIGQGIEIITQIKIYNEHLRKRYGFWFCWKHEETKLKYFRNKKKSAEFARNLDSLDRIDKVIEAEVRVSIKEAEERGAKLFKDKEQNNV